MPRNANQPETNKFSLESKTARVYLTKNKEPRQHLCHSRGCQTKRHGATAVAASSGLATQAQCSSCHSTLPQHMSHNKNWLKMAYQEPCKECRKAAAPISSWNCPLLTFIYPGLIVDHKKEAPATIMGGVKKQIGSKTGHSCACGKNGFLTQNGTDSC